MFCLPEIMKQFDMNEAKSQNLIKKKNYAYRVTCPCAPCSDANCSDLSSYQINFALRVCAHLFDEIKRMHISNSISLLNDPKRELVH